MNKLELLKKTPWGIISAVAAMIFSLVIIAVFVLYGVNCVLAVEETAIVTIFDTWYQTLLFVVTCLSGIIFIASIVFYILRKRALKAIEKKEEDINEDIL